MQENMKTKGRGVQSRTPYIIYRILYTVWCILHCVYCIVYTVNCIDIYVLTITFTGDFIASCAVKSSKEMGLLFFVINGSLSRNGIHLI